MKRHFFWNEQINNVCMYALKLLLEERNHNNEKDQQCMYTMMKICFWKKESTNVYKYALKLLLEANNYVCIQASVRKQK